MTQTTTRYVRVLTIAGSDSGGGAGIQADLKTIAAHGCYGMSAVTALTAQNTVGVQAINGVPASFLRAQLDAVATDIGVDAVKIGMLHAPEIVEEVAQAIDRHGWDRVVLDPVMVATSGDRLIAPETQAVLVDRLFPRATVVTPNLDEAAWLLGRDIPGRAALVDAARALQAMGAGAVLLKGGHLSGPVVEDVLVSGDAAPVSLTSDRIETPNTHGTGCTLSSAIACQLALGAPLADACRAARDYVMGALRSGADVRTGHGHGPLDHGFAPRPSVHRPR